MSGDPSRQALVGIVQGGFHRSLREESALRISDLDLPGIAIGGVSVGEPTEMSRRVLEWTVHLLPSDRPRYLMGVGTPLDLLEAVEAGIDMFDCVLPTRLGRNGSIYTSRGRINVRGASLAEDWGPMDPECDCHACRRYSASYVRHLYRCDEILAARLATYHNLHFYAQLMTRIRSSIELGLFAAYKREFLSNYNGSGH